MRKVFRTLCFISTVVFGMAGAQAQTSGLGGAYYVLGSAPGSNAAAEAAILGVAPSATFVATLLCYPGCGVVASDGVSLNDFLGSNATAMTPNAIASLNDHVMVLTGYLKIAAAGTYTLGLGSDDGSKLVLDGVELSNDGDHPFITVTRDYTLASGLHAIRILQFEDGGQSGLTVSLNGTALDSSMLQTAAVPEPATWATLLCGAVVVAIATRRRRYRRDELCAF